MDVVLVHCQKFGSMTIKIKKRIADAQDYFMIMAEIFNENKNNSKIRLLTLAELKRNKMS